MSLSGHFWPFPANSSLDLPGFSTESAEIQLPISIGGTWLWAAVPHCTGRAGRWGCQGSQGGLPWGAGTGGELVGMGVKCPVNPGGDGQKCTDSDPFGVRIRGISEPSRGIAKCTWPEVTLHGRNTLFLTLFSRFLDPN